MDGEPDLAADGGGDGDADVVALYGRVVGMRLSAESLRGALAAADARLEDDIKREAAAEKEADAAERRLAEKARSLLKFATRPNDFPTLRRPRRSRRRSTCWRRRGARGGRGRSGSWSGGGRVGSSSHSKPITD